MTVAAVRAQEALALSKGDHSARPWDREAEQLLAAAELAEAGARTAVAKAVSVGAPTSQQAYTAALLDRAEALRISLARRKHLGAITADELSKARAALARVQSGKMARAAVERAHRRRLERLDSSRRSVQAEFEQADTSDEMVKQMAAALLAENQRAAGHMKRLPEGSAQNEAGRLVDWSAKTYTALVERADGGAAAMPKGEWDRAVDALAGIRYGVNRLEARLRLGAI